MLKTNIMANFQAAEASYASLLDPSLFAGKLEQTQASLKSSEPATLLYAVPFIVIDDAGGSDTTVAPIEIDYKLVQHTHLFNPAQLDPDTAS